MHKSILIMDVQMHQTSSSLVLPGLKNEMLSLARQLSDQQYHEKVEMLAY